MRPSFREAILAAARRSAQAHGYNGLNFRVLAAEIGIKAASIHHHFPSKVDLGAAVARRYWEDAASVLEAISAESPNPIRSLYLYPDIFRTSLENGNRICLCSFMSAEFDDLPEPVKQEVQAFADVNIAWLGRMLIAAGSSNTEADARAKAEAIYASVAGAQLMARRRSEPAVFDALIETYRTTGLLPPAPAGA